MQQEVICIFHRWAVNVSLVSSAKTSPINFLLKKVGLFFVYHPFFLSLQELKAATSRPFISYPMMHFRVVSSKSRKHVRPSMSSEYVCSVLANESGWRRQENYKNILVSISVASVQQEQLIEGYQDDGSFIS